jgi:hypothetical protein
MDFYKISEPPICEKQIIEKYGDITQ